MKESPIIFNPAMVEAIFPGRKTQTRRTSNLDTINKNPDLWSFIGFRACLGYPASEGYLWAGFIAKTSDCPVYIKCPFGQAGDRLWVREAWRVGSWDEDGNIAVDYRAGNYSSKKWIQIEDPEIFEKLMIQSSDDADAAKMKTDGDGWYVWEPGDSPCRWRPSIHMYRWASRVNLEITNIRVERVQDISEEDAEVEGVEYLHPDIKYPYKDYLLRTLDGCSTARESFYTLWDSINKKRGFGWDQNPWVWVVEFKKIDKEKADD